MQRWLQRHPQVLTKRCEAQTKACECQSEALTSEAEASKAQSMLAFTLFATADPQNQKRKRTRIFLPIPSSVYRR